MWQYWKEDDVSGSGAQDAAACGGSWWRHPLNLAAGAPRRARDSVAATRLEHLHRNVGGTQE